MKNRTFILSIVGIIAISLIAGFSTSSALSSSSTNSIVTMTITATPQTNYINLSNWTVLVPNKTVTLTQTQTDVQSFTITSESTLTLTKTMNQYFTTTTTKTITSASSTIFDSIMTGNSWVDQYDSLILNSSEVYHEDPMLIKSQIALESYFNASATSQDIPCGKYHSLGLMQITPDCVSGFNVSLAYVPWYNIEFGTKLMSQQISLEKSLYSGCSTPQYLEMALGAYNSGQSSIYGCSSYSSRAQSYISVVLNWYSKFSSESGYLDFFQ